MLLLFSTRLLTGVLFIQLDLLLLLILLSPGEERVQEDPGAGRPEAQGRQEEAVSPEVSEAADGRREEEAGPGQAAQEGPQVPVLPPPAHDVAAVHGGAAGPGGPRGPGLEPQHERGAQAAAATDKALQVLISWVIFVVVIVVLIIPGPTFTAPW